MARRTDGGAPEFFMTQFPSITRSDRLTPEQKALLHKRDGLDLSRRRVIHDLETSTSPVYRRNLEAGLAFLDSEIAEVDRLLVTSAQSPPPEPPRAGPASAKRPRH